MSLARRKNNFRINKNGRLHRSLKLTGGNPLESLLKQTERKSVQSSGRRASKMGSIQIRRRVRSQDRKVAASRSGSTSIRKCLEEMRRRENFRLRSSMQENILKRTRKDRSYSQFTKLKNMATLQLNLGQSKADLGVYKGV